MATFGNSNFSRSPLSNITLKFQNIEYQLPTKSKNSSIFSINKVEKKRILKGLSGHVSPGELLVMLGPSGSGKTTLLSALGGRLANQNLTGSITYNNKTISNLNKRKIGFVTQQDTFYPHLTVFETLYYTALLRLPNSLTKNEKVEQANLIINQLGLTKCRNGIIGGTFIRGVSGGERKRVSIGQEMLVNPSLLFLDEPTSGLDSTTAQRIMTMLKEFTIFNNRTLVMTIHQPSSRLFYMFHKILLLSDGSPVYFGKGTDAINYFAGVGFSPEIAMNPSDFLLDLSNGIASYEEVENGNTTEIVKHKLMSAYVENIYPILAEKFKEQDNQNIHKESNIANFELTWCTSWWTQFHVLFKRDIKERKHQAFTIFTTFQVMVIAILSSILWWQSQTRVEDQIGLLFFITIFWAFFVLFQSIYAFPSKRAMIAKERMSGMYRLSSYFTSSMICDLPMNLTLPTIFLIIVYWASGLKPDVVTFFATFLVLLLNVLVADGLGLALGALFMDLRIATTLGTIIMVASMIVSGFFVKHVPTTISWIKYLFVGYHTFKLFVDIQFSKTDTYECGGNDSCLVTDLSSLALIKLDVGTWWSVLALLLMLVACRLLAYFALKRLGKVN